MAYLKVTKVGDIVSVPTSILFQRRVGSSRYDWKPALVTKVYNAKGGKAITVDFVSQNKKVTRNFLVSKCQKQTFTIPLSEKSQEDSISIVTNSPKYSNFFKILGLSVENYKRQIKDYR